MKRFVIAALALICVCPLGRAGGRMSRNVLREASYTYNTYGGKETMDPSRVRLTDERLAVNYDNWDWARFEGSDYYDIDFTLASPQSIYAVEAEALGLKSWGIYMPSRMEVYSSLDGREYKLVGTVSPGEVNDGKHLIRLDSRFRASYIRFRIYRSKNIVCLDQVRAFAYDPKGDILPGRHTNLDFDAYGTPSLRHFLPMTPEQVSRNTPASEVFPKLTDSRKATSTDFSDPVWVRFVNGGGRHIVFDLGTTKSVFAFAAQFLRDTRSGINVPPVLMVSVSENATDWVTVHAAPTLQYLEDFTVNGYDVFVPKPDCRIWNFETSFRPVRARYVRLSFETERIYVAGNAVYISEVRVGSSSKLDGVSEAAVNMSNSLGRYPTVAEAGCNALFYASVKPVGAKNFEKQQITPEQAEFMFTRRVGDSPVREQFFDAVCFTSFGAHGVSSSDLLSAIFDERYNLAAIERTMEELSAERGEDCSVGVWITIPTLRQDNNFENFVQPLIDSFISEFESRSYRHLRLLGTYWENEGACYSQRNVIMQTNEYVHSLGLKSFWCPYYGQASMWRWKDWGFDWACMQPNIMFAAHAANDLYMAAETARIFGMTVELEIDAPSSETVCNTLRDYYRTGEESGFAESVKVFYLGGTPNALISAEKSEYPYAKTLLEETYLFVK